MTQDAVASRLETMEKLELDNSAAGVAVSAQIYSQMLALYLHQNDLCNAKYLWKRIPAATKAANPEIENVWKVGQKMWQRDFPGIYVVLAQEWSPELKEIMESISVITRERAGKLVATAYSYINLDTLAALTGLTQDEAADQARAVGWEVDLASNLVKPNKPAPPATQNVSCEEQLGKLTDFVSFLEN